MPQCVQLATITYRLSQDACIRAYPSKHYPLMSASCRLFAACYNLCFMIAPRQTRSQKSLMSMVENYAQQVLYRDVNEWLNKQLRVYLAYNKWNRPEEEFDVSDAPFQYCKI